MVENRVLGSISPRFRLPALAVSCVLATEIILFYSLSTAEYIPTPPPLTTFQKSVGAWQMTRETQIETEVQALLKADDTLSREYKGPQGPLDFFVAFFKSQRAGVTPHSPKVCLPGAGWTPLNSGIISIRVPGEADPIPVNRYIVSHGDEQSLVLYWYQGAHRVVASEYLSKLYLMIDSLRYHRSDAALVRVIVPIVNNNRDQTEGTAIQFIQQAYAPLKEQMWR